MFVHSYWRLKLFMRLFCRHRKERRGESVKKNIDRFLPSVSQNIWLSVNIIYYLPGCLSACISILYTVFSLCLQ